MRTEEEIKNQLEASKKMYFDDNSPLPTMYTKGWVYALNWVLGNDNEDGE